jgi:hypothetical protein
VDDYDSIVELRKGVTLLGILSNIRLYDWPWYACDFKTTPEFDLYRPLFDEEVQILESEGANDRWDASYAKIEKLNLTLVYIDEAKVSTIFLLHVEGKEARFKAVFEESLSLPLQPAACRDPTPVDNENVARNIGRSLRCQEDRCACHVARLTQPVQRDLG